jgi:hypothetical protein
MAYRLVVPANTDIHIEAEVHAGYAQRVWAYYVLVRLCQIGEDRLRCEAVARSRRS